MGPISSDAARRHVQGGALLLDVRMPDEFAGGHIDNAVNIPLLQLGGRLADVGEKNHPVVVYCQAGGRSMQAKLLLEANGFEQVYDLGGIGRW